MNKKRENDSGQMPTIGAADVLNESGEGEPNNKKENGAEEPRAKEDRKAEIPQVEVGKVSVSGTAEAEAIDNTVRQNSIESDRAYRQITVDIINITSKQLEEHNRNKKPLRKDLLDFVKGLLAAQFVMLIVLLLYNNVLELNISDSIFQAYIVSMFVETLAGLIIMIKYAFDSTQEVKLIAILNEIISHFKKFDEK